MDMIGPALTSHEWAELRFEPLSNDEIAIRDDGDGLEIVVYGGPADRTERTNLLAKYKLDDSVPIDRHALAALTLYGQPYGFRIEMADAIEHALTDTLTPEDSLWLRTAQSVILSLLPPGDENAEVRDVSDSEGDQ